MKKYDITIGKPIANTQIYIVDKYMNITPIGVTGELCIAGDGVGKGYLNRPELTAEKFIDNPFGEGKLYKTGDLAFWREDGNISYVGRNDFQVKVRGLRIELGEIENAICSVDGVLQAVVVVRKGESGRQLICAFYTQTKAVDAAEIKKTILKKLPKYMLPHIFTRLEKLPLTSSGKINRKALPEVDLSTVGSGAEFVMPKTELQRRLASIFEAVLAYSPIGLEDDFFDVGGDSLKAIELVSKAHNEDIFFNLQAVFDNPTVGALCNFIQMGDSEKVSYADKDFESIQPILNKNKIGSFGAAKAEIGNILITGATGFLGAHILNEYLKNDNGTAYCLVRGESQKASEERLSGILEYYFKDTYRNCERIKVICADVVQHFEEDVDVQTVIHCAASVKHYGSYKYFYDVNVGATKNMIAFAKKRGARLLHISTLSVSGNSFGDDFNSVISKEEKHFYERSLYIEQDMENVYARSKFEAEKAVLEAMRDGLSANIFRMGNLTNRYYDGVFQPNYTQNAFLNRFKAALEFGMLPDYLLKLYAEFSPIDYSAKAVMEIARHFNDTYTVFHINSHKPIYFDEFVKVLRDIGIKIEVVEGKVFAQAIKATMKNSQTSYIYEAFINDMDDEDRLVYDSNIHIENDFTVKYLNALGFDWPRIDAVYLKKYIDYFRSLGYLEV